MSNVRMTLSLVLLPEVISNKFSRSARSQVACIILGAGGFHVHSVNMIERRKCVVNE